MATQNIQIFQIAKLSKGKKNTENDGLKLLKNALAGQSTLDTVILDDLTYYKKIKFYFNKSRKYIAYERLSDRDFYDLIKCLDNEKNSLIELYANWNKEVHVNKIFINTSDKSGSDEFLLAKEFQRLNQGTLGKECSELIYKFLSEKNLQVFSGRNNQFPYEFNQNFEIVLKYQSNIMDIDLTGNVEIVLYYDDHWVFTCCCGILSCFSKCCCSGLKQVSFKLLPISDNILNKIKFKCNNNRDKPRKLELFNIEKQKYDGYKGENMPQARTNNIQTDIQQSQSSFQNPSQLQQQQQQQQLNKSLKQTPLEQIPNQPEQQNNISNQNGQQENNNNNDNNIQQQNRQQNYQDSEVEEERKEQFQNPPQKTLKQLNPKPVIIHQNIKTLQQNNFFNQNQNNNIQQNHEQENQQDKEVEQKEESNINTWTKRNNQKKDLHSLRRAQSFQENKEETPQQQRKKQLNAIPQNHQMKMLSNLEKSNETKGFLHSDKIYESRYLCN